MPTTSNTQYNTQRLKTVAAVQTFKKQYSFKACIAAVADPGKELGGPGLPLFFYRNEARRAQNNFLERALPLSLGQLTADRPPLPPPPSLKVWIRHCAVTSARRRPRRDSEFCKRLKREKLNRSQKVCLKESE